MSRMAIKAAFDQRLQAFNAPGLGDIAWEGIPYFPNEGTPYIAARLSAYARTPLGVGANCYVQEAGMYALTINRPAAEGDAKAGWLAEQLTLWFPRGITLSTLSGQPIIIENSSEQPAQPTGNWLVLPVIVSWISVIT